MLTLILLMRLLESPLGCSRIPHASVSSHVPTACFVLRPVRNYRWRSCLIRILHCMASSLARVSSMTAAASAITVASGVGGDGVGVGSLPLFLFAFVSAASNGAAPYTVAESDSSGNYRRGVT